MPKAFDKLINRALAKDPRQRYQSAREFAQDVQALSRRLHSGSSVLVDRLVDWWGLWRKPGVAGSMAALALGLGVLGVFWPYHR